MRVFLDARDGGLELSGDEILADGMIFKDKKSPKDKQEVTIGVGMEFTIHGNKFVNIFSCDCSEIA